jgi:hypothetical protein
VAANRERVSEMRDSGGHCAAASGCTTRILARAPRER